MNRLAITKVNACEKEFVAYNVLDEQRKLVDFQLFPIEQKSILNNIYIAKVADIIENINAAFVMISPTTKCFLPLENLKNPIFVKKMGKKDKLCQGDEIVVQVVKEAVKTKDAVVSCQLTFEGNYTVLTTSNKRVGISKKIEEEKRNVLWEKFIKYKNKDYGIIIRTNSVEVDVETVEKDLNSIIDKYQKIVTYASHKNVFDVLYESEKGYIVKLRKHNSELMDFVYTDDEEIFKEISNHLPYLVEQNRVRFYDDKALSLKSLYNINGAMDELKRKLVWLNSGANIIIEQLETLTVIDINTGKNAKTSNVIEKVNKEAAREIARQIRLRNISGMIIIDFINMKSKEQDNELIEVLKREIAKDPVTTSFVDITKLGLVELTRKKISKSLKEILTY